MKHNIIKKVIVALGSALLGVIAYSFVAKEDETLKPDMDMEDELDESQIAEVIEKTVSEEEEDKKSKKK